MQSNASTFVSSSTPAARKSALPQPPLNRVRLGQRDEQTLGQLTRSVKLQLIARRLAAVEGDHVVQPASQRAPRGAPRDDDGLRFDPQIRVADYTAWHPWEFQPAPCEARLHVPIDHCKDLGEGSAGAPEAAD